MKLRVLGWLALGLWAGVLAKAAGEAPARVDDPGHLLPSGEAGKIAARLDDFEQRTGIRVLVQFHAKSPLEAEDKVPGAYMSALSGKLGTRQHGLLVVYFADDPDWRVWIGDELASRFAGKPGTVRELTASGAIHAVKEAMLDSAHAQAEAAFATLQKSAPTNSPPTPAQHLQLQTEALLEALTAKFSGK
jgi:hypothetical protein